MHDPQVSSLCRNCIVQVHYLYLVCSKHFSAVCDPIRFCLELTLTYSRTVRAQREKRQWPSWFSFPVDDSALQRNRINFCTFPRKPRVQLVRKCMSGETGPPRRQLQIKLSLHLQKSLNNCTSICFNSTEVIEKIFCCVTQNSFHFTHIGCAPVTTPHSFKRGHCYSTVHYDLYNSHVTKLNVQH